MNHPLIIARPASAKARLSLLLTALEFGLYPADGSTDEELDQAAADQQAVGDVLAYVRDADTDAEAQRVFMDGIGRLAGLSRFGVASGIFTTGEAA